MISKLSDHQNNRSAKVWTMRIVVHHAGAAGRRRRGRAHVRSQTDQEKLSAARAQLKHGYDSFITRARAPHIEKKKKKEGTKERRKEAQTGNRHRQRTSDGERRNIPTRCYRSLVCQRLQSVDVIMYACTAHTNKQTNTQTHASQSQSRGAPRWHTAQGCESRAKAKAA